MKFKNILQVKQAIASLREKFPAWEESMLENALDNNDTLAETEAWIEQNIKDKEELDAAAKAEAGKKKESKNKKLKQLSQGELVELFSRLGFNFALNELNDDLYLNGRRIGGNNLAKPRQTIRDVCLIERIAWEPAVVKDAILAYAEDHAFNPLKDFFNTLPAWDGQGHLEYLASCLKSPSPNVYRWLEAWFAAAVRKIYEQKHGHTLVLHGQQRIGKSFLCRAICSPCSNFFIESAIKTDDKDCLLRGCDSLVWEIGEANRLLRKDPEEIKFFLSTEYHRLRKPYAETDIIKPVTASYICTLNKAGGIFSDDTGNRRFLTLELTAIDRAYSGKIDWKQVWAQAKVLYQQGKWKLTEEEETVQETENTNELIENPVDTFLAHGYVFTLGSKVLKADVLDFLVHKGLQPNRTTQMQIAKYMTSIGAKKTRIMENTKQDWYWDNLKPA